MLDSAALSPSELAGLLLAHWENPDADATDVFDLWVHLLDHDPSKAWLAILAVADQARSGQHLCNLGAIFLEQFICDHADIALPLIAPAVQYHPNLVAALGAVWLGPDDPPRNAFLALLVTLNIRPSPYFYGPIDAA